ncbi:MAG: AI-2E family transporter [Burkholderiaceae bacterium]|jgi:predicted PurR-regulated permease PerM|nr:AI-2E family transporter [Burkholderiaceae bacterium]
MNTPQIQRAVFLTLLAAVSAAFAWVLTPFFGAVFWAVVLALLFAPLQRRILARVGQRRTLATLLTLMVILVVVCLPLALISVNLVSEIIGITQKVRAGQIDFNAYGQQIVDTLPGWTRHGLEQLGLTSPSGVFDKISGALAQGGQFLAARTITIGQNTFQFLVGFVVMLYLLFFLLRDGANLTALLRRSIPLGQVQTRYLLDKFATVVRATVKGNIFIALLQGILGGIAFAVLGIQGAVFWGVVMAFLSLVPAVGAALVWAPVAIYLLATGSIWQGAALLFWGVVVISLTDSLLRPLLVGKNTRMPDYLVLISTLGGMSLFGINGFVIGPTIAALFIAAWSLFNDADRITQPPVEPL